MAQSKCKRELMTLSCAAFSIPFERLFFLLFQNLSFLNPFLKDWNWLSVKMPRKEREEEIKMEGQRSDAARAVHRSMHGDHTASVSLQLNSLSPWVTARR